MTRFPRITTDPRQCGGAPCIRGLRIPVATVVGLVAQDVPWDRILTDYPDLTVADIVAALTFHDLAQGH